MDPTPRIGTRLARVIAAFLAVLVATALAWVLREPKAIGDLRVPGLADAWPGLSDAGIAIVAAVVLFVLPTSRTAREFALDWKSAARIIRL